LNRFLFVPHSTRHAGPACSDASLGSRRQADRLGAPEPGRAPLRARGCRWCVLPRPWCNGAQHTAKARETKKGQHAGHALLLEATSPAAYRVGVHLRSSGDLLVGHTVCRSQQRPGLSHRAVRQRRRARHALQLCPIVSRHGRRFSGHHWHAAALVRLTTSATDH